jgi:hypothetical protein
MNTSLAASPVLPIAAAAVAAALIFGTLSTSSNASTDAAATGGPAAEDPTAYVPVELPGSEPAANPAAPANPAASGKVTTSCKGNVCTIVFPAEGGVAKVLGTTVTATKFYGDGITVTVGNKPLVTNLTTPAKGGGYTVQATKVDNGAASPHTVKVTKNK